MSPLKGWRLWGAWPSDHQVHRLGPTGLHVGASGVEVRVAGHNLSLAARDLEEDALGGAALAGRNDVLEGHDPAHGLLEAVVGGRAGVAFVPAHQCAPLRSAHRRGARVGRQVDDDVLGAQVEEVVARLRQQPGALRARRQANRLDALDAKRLDDRVHGGGANGESAWLGRKDRQRRRGLEPCVRERAARYGARLAAASVAPWPSEAASSIESLSTSPCRSSACFKIESRRPSRRVATSSSGPSTST